jgi:NAD(P)H-hydrate repair Nnr-like enzyme with NAD(P)H-hydrate epimerase domain
MLKIPLACLAVAGILVGVSACGKTTIDQSSEVDLVNKSLQQHNLKAKSVDCPSDVDAKEGTTFSCDVVLTNGKTGTFDIKVTSVSGDHAQLQITGARSTGKTGG